MEASVFRGREPDEDRVRLDMGALDSVSARVSWRVGNRLRERLAAHALRLEQAWHGRHSPGQLIERIDGEIDGQSCRAFEQ